ncbi:ATPase [Exophiala aquamarina CBS 119918]|uniref:ATPase n=1 Tax=Exophiala aquamarina CBS 119918 TaxID=1182545 RepID=A0A072PQP0_9EURO|nr:ATPase [Exophiala aquamarina CBS 119918]KEF62072.1 ATPase [Exophiala aquamarina CBS 119918]
MAETSQEEQTPRPGYLAKFKAAFNYFSVFVQANPSPLDIFLLVTGVAFAIAAGVPFPLLAIIYGQLLDDFNGQICAADTQASVNNNYYQNRVNDKILYMVYLGIAHFCLVYIHLVCWSLGGARLAQRLREHYLRSLLRKEPAFFDTRLSGEVSSRLNGDISMIRMGTSEKVGICLSSISFFVTAYIVSFIKIAKLAGVLVALVPAFFSMSLIGGYFVKKSSSEVSDHFAAASSVASEALTNVAVVHAFNANNKLESNFSSHLRLARKAGIDKALANGIQSGLVYFIAYSADALAFWQGSHMIADAVAGQGKETTIGAVFTVVFLLVDATLILSQMTPFLAIFAGAAAAFGKLKEDIDAPSVIDGIVDTGLRLPADAAGEFKLRNVSFTYPSRPEQKVLQNVSLSFPAGKKTAIVGFSGSGKSTIASLLLRLYDPIEGSVTLDGQELHELNTRQVRGMVGLVQQEATLLDRSVLENVAHGLVNSATPGHERFQDVLLGPQLNAVAAAMRAGTEAKEAAREQGPIVEEIIDMVQHAMDISDAARFIKNMPEGLGTMVGASGTRLSGGQRQRIAIARSIIKNPKILILDEATASLDSQSEREILEALERCSEGRTVISVAHRLSTIHKADNIVVMGSGRVLEQGTHPELMSKHGAYARLVSLQNLDSTSAARQSNEDVSLSGVPEMEKVEHDLEKTENPEISIAVTKGGDILSPAATKEDQVHQSLTSVTKAMSRFIRPHALVALFALAGASIVGGAYCADAVIFGHTVGGLSPCRSPSQIRDSGRFYALMFFVLAIIEFFANIASWVGFGWVSEKTIYTIRVSLFRALFDQDVQWHQSKGRTAASLLGLITNDGNQIAGLSGSIIGTILSICINLFAAVIMTMIIAWKLAIVCMSIVPLLLSVGFTQLRALARFADKHEHAFNKSVGVGVEAVSSMKTVATLSLEHEILGVYQRTLEGPTREVTAISFYANVWLALQYLIGNLAFALGFWWGSKQVFNGTYSQTQFIMVVFSLLVSAQLWTQMFALAPEITNARSAIARVTNVIALGSSSTIGRSSLASKERDIEAIAEIRNIVLPQGSTGMDVKLQNVYFSYPARQSATALHDLSLHIRPGQFCGLVGPSGAGKSTITSLIERMYVSRSGEILIDGKDITKQDDLSFRDDIALVPQDGVLFDGTIRFNLSLGARPGTTVSDEEMIEACKLASIYETILQLPQGFDTPCGTNGSKLSGGQKHRLAIARALVRKPRLLILDEPTSALDAETERTLQENLRVATRGISVLVIAHRLSTIRHADAIFLIEAGRCVDAGTHDELFERSESYRANVLSQMIAA